MKIIEAINQIDSLKPNAYSIKQKLLWLSQLEAMVRELVIGQGGGEAPSHGGITDDTDVQTLLLMPSPFDLGYLYWLEAQIHYANEDMDMYNSAITMFNTTFREYKAHYRRNHASKDRGRFRF